MSETAEKLKNQLAVLSLEDRVELLEFLEVSLANGDLEENEAEWDAELERRWQRIKTGKAVGFPIEQVADELRKKYP
jgi:putative addiction module component (TIGR02574 family)